ncbi:MAG: hypothetical protein AAFQ22_13190 [Pseudomonadota bacterium]
MYELAPLIARIEAYAKAANIAESTASRRVFGDGDRLDGLKTGSSLTLKTAQRAMVRLDELEARLPKEGAAA